MSSVCLLGVCARLAMKNLFVFRVETRGAALRFVFVFLNVNKKGVTLIYIFPISVHL